MCYQLALTDCGQITAAPPTPLFMAPLSGSRFPQPTYQHPEAAAFEIPALCLLERAGWVCCLRCVPVTPVSGRLPHLLQPMKEEGGSWSLRGQQCRTQCCKGEALESSLWFLIQDAPCPWGLGPTSEAPQRALAMLGLGRNEKGWGLCPLVVASKIRGQVSTDFKSDKIWDAQ